MLGPGSTIGSYRVASLLGQGGMGQVYLAEHTELERRVAIKVLRAEQLKDPESLARFALEARAAARIGHPHIVDVIDVGTTSQGERYFVMELLQGQTLASRLLRQGRLPWRRAVHIVEQLAAALSAAHAQGIVHRDL